MESVSPLEAYDVGNCNDADDGKEEVGLGGEDLERLALEKDGGEVRKLVDPLLPNKKDVDEHWVRGHLPYRNWCEVCVRSRGREMDHQTDKGKERKYPSTILMIVFLGMSSDLNGRFWLGRKG